MLKPESYAAHMFDLDAVRRNSLDALEPGTLDLRLPRPSVARNQAALATWRRDCRPAQESAKAFVSAVVVAHMTRHGNVLGKIDDDSEEWRGSLELGRSSFRHRARRRFCVLARLIRQEALVSGVSVQKCRSNRPYILPNTVCSR